MTPAEPAVLRVQASPCKVLTVSRANFPKFLQLLPDFEERIKKIAELRAQSNAMANEPSAAERLRQQWRRGAAPTKLLHIHKRLTALRHDSADSDSAWEKLFPDGMPSVSDFYEAWRASTSVEAAENADAAMAVLDGEDAKEPPLAARQAQGAGPRVDRARGPPR